MTRFTESVVEDAPLAWLKSIGWRVAHGPDIAPDTLGAERRNYGEVVLAQRLRDALARLNPALPAAALEDAFRKLTRPEGAELIQRNRALHRLLVDGVTVEYHDKDGSIRGAQARVSDFEDPANNDWLAVNQFSGTQNKHTRRPDVRRRDRHQRGRAVDDRGDGSQRHLRPHRHGQAGAARTAQLHYRVQRTPPGRWSRVRSGPREPIGASFGSC